MYTPILAVSTHVITAAMASGCPKDPKDPTDPEEPGKPGGASELTRAMTGAPMIILHIRNFLRSARGVGGAGSSKRR
jgi:hypothetical protein